LHSLRRLAPIICTLCLLLPSVASAADAPPGNAAVQEFVENLPDGAGRRTSNDVANSRETAFADGHVVAGATRRRLTAQGRDGGDIVSLAEASGPQPSDGQRPRAPVGQGASPIEAVADRLVSGSGPGGMGVALPLLLLASLLAAVVAVRRPPQRT
jgi:hypothetical protein